MLIAYTKLIKMELIIHLDHLHLHSHLKLEENNNSGKVKNQKYLDTLKMLKHSNSLLIFSKDR